MKEETWIKIFIAVPIIIIAMAIISKTFTS